MMCAVPSFQAHSCSSDGKLSNSAKIAAIYLSHELCRGREKGREGLIERRRIVNVPTHVVD